MTIQDAVKYIREHNLEAELGEAIRDAMSDDDESPRSLGNYVLDVFEDSFNQKKDAASTADSMFTMVVGTSLQTMAGWFALTKYKEEVVEE